MCEVLSSLTKKKKEKRKGGRRSGQPGLKPNEVISCYERELPVSAACASSEMNGPDDQGQNHHSLKGPNAEQLALLEP